MSSCASLRNSQHKVFHWERMGKRARSISLTPPHPYFDFLQVGDTRALRKCRAEENSHSVPSVFPKFIKSGRFGLERALKTIQFQLFATGRDTN